MSIHASSFTPAPRLRRWLVGAAALLGLHAGAFAAPHVAATPAPQTAPPPVQVAMVAPPQAAAPDGLVRVADGRMLAPDIARIVERGELVVAMLASDMPPFFEERDGQLVGLEVEMANEIARELKVSHVRFDRSAKTFNEVVDVVARHEADLGISKLSRTLARAQVIRFSAPYLRLNHALVLNRVAFAGIALDKTLPAVVRDFSGSLGVIAKSSFADYATRNFPRAKIHPYPAWDDVVAAVRRGEVIGAYRDEFEIKRLLRADPTASLTLRTVTLKDLEDSLGIAVNAQSPVLLAFVNQFLEQRPAKLDIDKVLQAVSSH